MFLSTNEPSPLKYETLFFLNKPSIPFVNDTTTPFLFYWTFDQLRFGFGISIPYLLKSWFASWNLWDMLNKAFDGIHPIFKQVPPKAPRF